MADLPLQNSEQNILKYIADALRKVQEMGNQVDIPMLGGAGDLLVGNAQDTMEKLSYGESPTSGSGQTLQLDPGVADLAGVAGSMPLAKAGIQKMAGKVARGMGADKRAAHQMMTRTQSGVKPSNAELSNALSKEDVLSKGMIESGQREAYRRAAPRPYRRQPAPKTKQTTPIDELTPEARQQVGEAVVRSNKGKKLSDGGKLRVRPY